MNFSAKRLSYITSNTLYIGTYFRFAYAIIDIIGPLGVAESRIKMLSLLQAHNSQ